MSFRIIFIAIALVLIWSCNTKKLKREDVKLDATENKLLDKVQRQSFDYYWKGVEPVSGAARERIHMDAIYEQNDADVVTSGGTGFGVMALLVGIERGFISRQQGYARLDHLTKWLEKADRFHGAWPHWLYPDGKVKPFSTYDDGGDLVETAYLIQGLLAARQYFKQGNAIEKPLLDRIDRLWKSVEWDFYTQNKNVLYWHWSPQYEWKMNFAVRGYNECLIMYILAASSPNHTIDTAVFHQGFMRGGNIVSDKFYYDLPVVLDYYDGEDKAVGPLFWSHYSYLGLNPNGLKDRYADYFRLTQNLAIIHHRHSIKNPHRYKGYSDSCWGLTSSYSMKGYDGHNPIDDIGVISPTAALSSFPYTPDASMRFLKFIYHSEPGLIGDYGPYDAFSKQANWYLPRYLAIDQLTIPVMIENYRSGLIWNLFMSAPEIQTGLHKLGFEFNKIRSY